MLTRTFNLPTIIVACWKKSYIGIILGDKAGIQGFHFMPFYKTLVLREQKPLQTDFELSQFMLITVTEVQNCIKQIYKIQAK